MDSFYSAATVRTLIRFPYKRLQGLWQPEIPIGVKLEPGWKRIDVYVDSGATHTILRAGIADIAEFNYRTGQRISLEVGTGNLMVVYLHDLEVQLGSEKLTCTVGFSDQLGVKFNVLGKIGFFDQFKICFHQSQRSLTFETNE